MPVLIPGRPPGVCGREEPGWGRTPRVCDSDRDVVPGHPPLACRREGRGMVARLEHPGATNPDRGAGRMLKDSSGPKMA